MLWSRYGLTSDQIFHEIPYAEIVDRIRAARRAIYVEQREALKPAAFVSLFIGLSQGAKSKEFTSFNEFLRAHGLTDEVRRPPAEVERLRAKINQMSEDAIDRALEGAFFSRPGGNGGPTTVRNLGIGETRPTEGNL